jgi:hypothetical protein
MYIKHCLTSICLSFLPAFAIAQVGVGIVSPDQSAQLQVESASKIQGADLQDAIISEPNILNGASKGLATNSSSLTGAQSFNNVGGLSQHFVLVFDGNYWIHSAL